MLTSKKIVSILLKTAAGAVGLFILFLVIASVYIQKNKDSIIKKITADLNEKLNGELTIGNTDISIWSSFPNAGAVFFSVQLKDSLYNRPLLSVSKLQCRISLFSLFSNNKVLSSLLIEGGALHLFTDTSGYTNKYLLKSDEKANSESTNSSLVNIHALQFKNCSVLIEDSIREKKYQFSFTELITPVENDDSTIELKLSGAGFIRGLAFDIYNGTFFQNQSLGLKNIPLQFHKSSCKLSIGKSDFVINNHPYSIEGYFNLKDSPSFFLMADVQNIKVSQAGLLLTANIRNKLNDFGLKEYATIHAEISGSLNKPGDPYIYATVNAKNNKLEFIPATIENANIDGVFNNHISDTLPPCDRNSMVTIRQFTGNWNSIQLKGKGITITDLTNPMIDFVLTGNCKMIELDSMLSLSTIQLLQGRASIFLQYHGFFVNDLSLLNKTDVHITLDSAKILYEPRNTLFENCSGKIAVSEKKLQVTNLVCDIKKNHFKINAFTDSIKLTQQNNSINTNLTCTVDAGELNMEDFNYLFTAKNTGRKTRKSKGLGYAFTNVDKMLEYGNLHVNIRSPRIYKNNFSASDLNASLFFTEGEWRVFNASLKHAGGMLHISSSLHQNGNVFVAEKTKIDLENADVEKVFRSFDNFGLTGITYKNLQGTVTASVNINVSFTSKGTVVPRSLNGIAKVKLVNGALINLGAFKEMQKSIMKRRDLSLVKVASVQNTFNIRGSIIDIPRMEISSTIIRLFIEGTYDLRNENTDMSVQVPLNSLRKKDENDLPQNIGKEVKAGTSIYFRIRPGKDGDLKFTLDVFKKLRGNKNDEKGSLTN